MKCLYCGKWAKGDLNYCTIDHALEDGAFDEAEERAAEIAAKFLEEKPKEGR